MTKTRLTTALTAALLVAVAACGAMGLLYSRLLTRNAELEAQVEELAKKESRSAVMQSINAQMEEIANQQRRVSDMQREEAIQQRKKAEEERRNADMERRAAEEQRQNALIAERKAVEASDMAQRQRLIAEQQRAEAETAKRVTDTLSYIAMARNLASMAMTQATAGNAQLANLLTYTAYTFTTRYRGDVYNAAIYQALSLNSDSKRKWSVANGAVMRMCNLPNSDDFVSVSTYGEILKHRKTPDGNLHTEAILQDSQYDFRDLYISDDGIIYALSRTGHLVSGKPGSLHTVVVERAEKPFRIFCHTEGELLVVAERSVHRLDAKTLQPLNTLALDFKTHVAGHDDHQLILFDIGGHAYHVDDKATTVKARTLPFALCPIMSYTYNWRTDCEAFGSVEGTIYMVDGKREVHQYVGHGSRVSRVNFEGNRLYSTSYDGTVRYWPFMQQKPESITVSTAQQWVISIFFDKTMKYIWTGDQNGNITETLIDPHIMAEKVHDKLKREYTKEEWQYYMGSNIPYETFIK